MTIKQKTKPVGRPKSEDRENTTGKGAKVSHFQIFKRSRIVFDRVLVNAPKAAKNRHHFFDILINFVYENQQLFYEYLDKMLK